MDSLYVSTRVTLEQARAEQMRRQAVVTSGYTFIVLQLIDNKKSRVSGVETLKPRKVESPSSPGLFEYAFDITSGPLVFEPDQNRGGVSTAYLLDTDWNRAILGTHHGLNYWRIVDVVVGSMDDAVQTTTKEVLEDIKARNKNAIAAVMRKPTGMTPELLPITTKQGVTELPDDELEARIRRLQAEKEKRIKLKDNEGEMKKKFVRPMKDDQGKTQESGGLITVR